MFSDLIQSHLSFRIPLLSVYQIVPNDESAILLPKALIDHRTAKINAPKQVILSLPKAAQHLIMACSEETNTFLSHGYSLEDLKSIPLCLAAIILQNPSLLTSLLDAGYDMTLLESSDLPIETRRKMLKDSKSLREIRMKDMQQKLSFCRFIGHFSSDPALEYQLSKKVALSLTAQGPLQALTAEGEEALLNPRQKALLQDLTLAPISSGMERAGHDIGTNAHALRSLALGLHVLDEEAKGPSHLQNIVEDCSDTNIQQLTQKYGESSLDALLKLNKEEGIISHILRMDKALAQGLIEYAKHEDFAFPSKVCKTPSWLSVIKEENIDILMQKAQNPSYFRAIVALRKQEITVEQLNTLPPKVLHAFFESVNRFNSGSLIKCYWKKLTEDLESLEILCSRLNKNQFMTLIYNISGTGIKLSKIASFEKTASIALVEASRFLSSADEDLIHLLKDHVVLRWLEGGKAELFKGVIFLLRIPTVTLDDIKKFDLQQPGKIQLLLHMANDIATAVKEYNFNWKDFFYSSTLPNKDCVFTSRIEVTLPPLNLLDKVCMKADLQPKDVFYLHHKGITLENLLRLQPELSHGALSSLPSIVEMYKKDPHFSFNDFTTCPLRHVLTSVLSVDGLVSEYEKTKLIETTFQNLLHLYSAKITHLSPLDRGQIVFFGTLENAGLIASQIEKKTLNWDMFIHDPHLKSILENILETGSITRYNRKKCASLFAGLIRLASSGLYPSSIYQLSRQHPLIRIQDPILSAEALTSFTVDRSDWIAFFSDSGAKELFDKVGYEGAEDILSLFKDVISLDQLAKLLSLDVIKKIIESAEELKTLEKADRQKCIELAEEDGFSRLQEKNRGVSFASLVKLRLIGFSLNDLWSTPYLHELAKISDVFYQCKDQAFSMPSQKASSTHRPAAADTDTESRTQSIIPFEMPELNKDEQATIHASINMLMQLKSILSSSPKCMMKLLANSENPIYVLKLLTQHPNIIEKILSLPEINQKEFLAEEYAELFAINQSVFSLFTSEKIRDELPEIFKKNIRTIFKNLDEAIHFYKRPGDAYENKNTSISAYISNWSNVLEINSGDLLQELLQITKTDYIENLESSSILVKISKRHTQLLSNLFAIIPIVHSSKYQQELITTLREFNNSLYSREFINLIDEKGVTQDIEQIRELRLFPLLSSHREIPSMMIESGAAGYHLFNISNVLKEIDEIFCMQTKNNIRFFDKDDYRSCDILDTWAGYTNNNKEQFYNAFIKAITSPTKGGGTEDFLALLDKEYTPLLTPHLNYAATYLYFLESFLKSNIERKNDIITNLPFTIKNIAIPLNITAFQDLLSIPTKILTSPREISYLLERHNNLFPVLTYLCQQSPPLSSRLVNLVSNGEIAFLEEIRQNLSGFKSAIESGKITIEQIYQTAKKSDRGTIKELIDIIAKE